MHNKSPSQTTKGFHNLEKFLTQNQELDSQKADSLSDRVLERYGKRLIFPKIEAVKGLQASVTDWKVPNQRLSHLYNFAA